MGTATSYTTAKIIEIANKSMVSAYVRPSDNHLIFVNGEGGTTDVGEVSSSAKQFSSYEFMPDPSSDYYVRVASSLLIGDTPKYYAMYIFTKEGMVQVEARTLLQTSQYTYNSDLAAMYWLGYSNTALAGGNTRYDQYLKISRTISGPVRIIVMNSAPNMQFDMVTRQNNIPTHSNGTPMTLFITKNLVELAAAGRYGIIRLAAVNEINAGTGEDAAITPAQLAISDSYRYFDTLYLTTSGTFLQTGVGNKGVRAYRIRAVGGGGSGGGGVASKTGAHSVGGGGGGGGYAEGFYKTSQFPNNIPYVVGRGGDRGTGRAGYAGGASTFGDLIKANGGGAGGIGPSISSMSLADGGPGGAGETGQLLIQGSAGMGGFGQSTVANGGPGGASILGGGGQAPSHGNNNVGLPGLSGGNYGGGGGGSASSSAAPAQLGGAGGDGIIIVERYK